MLMGAYDVSLIYAFGASYGTCGTVKRVWDSRSKGLGFDSHCWSCVHVLGKLILLKKKEDAYESVKECVSTPEV